MPEVHLIKHRGKVIGNANPSEIRRLIELGHITPFHKISDDGGANWRHASEMPLYRSLFANSQSSESATSKTASAIEHPTESKQVENQKGFESSSLDSTVPPSPRQRPGSALARKSSAKLSVSKKLSGELAFLSAALIVICVISGIVGGVLAFLAFASEQQLPMLVVAILFSSIALLQIGLLIAWLRRANTLLKLVASSAQPEA